jgi:hypothetical protein
MGDTPGRDVQINVGNLLATPARVKGLRKMKYHAFSGGYLGRLGIARPKSTA